MKRIEWILLVITLIGVVFIFAFIPGGNILFSFSLLLLSIIYYCLGFAIFNNINLKVVFKKASYSGLSQLRIVGSVLAGMSFSTLIIGMVFKMLNWPGSRIAMLLGLSAMLVLLVISAIKFISKKENFYKNMIVRTSVFIVFTMPLIIFSQYKIEKFQYRNYPDYLEVYENYLDDPSNENLQEQLHLERRKVTMKPAEYDKYVEWYNNQKAID